MDTQDRMAAAVIAATTRHSIGEAYKVAAERTGESREDVVEAYLSRVHLRRLYREDHNA